MTWRTSARWAGRGGSSRRATYVLAGELALGKVLAGELVRRPGAFRLFSRGMAAALEAGLPLRLNIVLTKTNAHEQEAMIAMAER